MIQFFIKLVNGWAGKVIFAILLFGMVFVLGYGGLNATGRYAGDAVTVGSRSLSLQQLDGALRRDHQRLSKLTGQNLSLKQAIEMGLLENVVRQQTNEMLLDAIKDELGLTASDTAVRKYIEQNPAFADAAGHFDRNLFLAYVRQSGQSEREFAKNLREELATQHLSRTLAGLAYAPDELVRLTYRHRNEVRDVTVLFVETDRLPVSEKPTEQELRDYYDIYASDMFATPEYRAFHLIHLTPEVLSDRVELSDDEIERAVAERRDQFAIPEKRLISQMFFTSEADAVAMKSGLNVADFDSLAASKLGQSKDLTDFGYVTREELTESLAEAAFAAKRNDIVGPIESPTGWHLLLVKDIQQASAPSADTVRQQVRDQLIRERVYAVYADTVRQLEELLGEGKSLADSAKALSLKLSPVYRADIAGVQPNGQPLPVSNQDLLQNLFTLKVGESTPLFDYKDGVVVAELSEVIPVGVRSFESVRADLEKLWLSEHQKAALEPTLNRIRDRFAAGTGLQTQASLQNFRLIRKDDLKRTEAEVLPPTVVRDIFRQKPGSENLTVIQTDKGAYVAVVNRIVYPDLGAAALNQTRAEVLDQTGRSLTSDTTAAYAGQFGVSVNDEAIRKAFSVYLTEQQ